MYSSAEPMDFDQMFKDHSAMDSQSSFYRHSTTAKTENAFRMRHKNKSSGNSFKGRMTKAEFQKRLKELQVNIPSGQQSPICLDYGQLDLSAASPDK